MHRAMVQQCLFGFSAGRCKHETMVSDNALLQRFVSERSQEAFAEFVSRHIGLVYHAALRQLNGDAHRAEDVTQQVFTDLARKAASLVAHPMIEGWLHTSTRFAARNLQRNEKNRQRYEREAGTMNSLLREESPAGAWEQLRPMIDDAVHQLDGRDRYAVLLRFFEGRTFAEVGVALGVGEDAARMRVERALAKLQRMLERRGVASTATALGVALANQAALAVPAGLSATVTGMALAGAGAAGASATGAALLNLMSITKITIGLAVIVALAGVGAAVREASAVRFLRGEWQNADHERSLAGAMNTRLQAKLAEADRDAKSARERIASLEQALQLSKQTSANPPAAHTSTAVNPYTNPEYSRLYLQKYRASLGLKYGALYKALQLTPDQISKFEAALADGEQGIIDIWAAAGSQGLTISGNSSSATSVARLTSDPMNSVQENLKSLLGESGYAAYQQFNRTQPASELVTSLAGAVYYSDTPLSSQQGTALAQIITNNTTTIKTPMADDGGGPVFSLSTSTDWNGVNSQAQAILTPTQLSALQAIGNLKQMDQNLISIQQGTPPAAKR